MSTFIAYFKKECIEILRNGKLFILLLLSVLFGIMNPGFAKLTPWLIKTMSESLEKSGLTVTDVTVNALTSWEQFYKNIPMLLFIFILMMCTIFSNEYQKGTLVLVLTKGLSRWKVYVSKCVILLTLWSVCYMICFGITYYYNDFYWDNSIAVHPILSALLIWLMGVWLISLILFFSSVESSNTAILCSTGGIFLIFYIANMFPYIVDYLPTKLMNSQTILNKGTLLCDYNISIIVTIIFSLVLIIAGLFSFNQKKL